MSDNAELPLSKHAYSFNETTRELLGPVEVFLSPLEGVYFLPRNVVDLAPPAITQPYQRARLIDDGTAWEIVPDFRGVMLWDTATCDPVANTLALGDALPGGVTAHAPPIFNAQQPLKNVWDSDTQTWRQVPDYSRTPVWSKADAQWAASPKPGEPLPDTLTTSAPPPFGAHQVPRWNATLQHWERIADYCGFVYWMPDGTQHVIDELGDEPPEGYLTSPPVNDPPQPSPTHT